MVVIYKLSCTVQEVIDDDHESVEDLKHNEDEQTDDKITDCCFCLKLLMISSSSSDYWCCKLTDILQILINSMMDHIQYQYQKFT